MSLESRTTPPSPPFRLRQGVYGQRQADVQMIRVKIPGGILTTESMNGLGEIADNYAPLGKGHITTREKRAVPPHTLGRVPRCSALYWEGWG